MATEYFTINHIHKDFYQQAHQTSASTRMFLNLKLLIDSDYRGGILAPFVLESKLKLG